MGALGTYVPMLFGWRTSLFIYVLCEDADKAERWLYLAPLTTPALTAWRLVDTSASRRPHVLSAIQRLLLSCALQDAFANDYLLFVYK
jgi:hypothetical protein